MNLKFVLLFIMTQIQLGYEIPADDYQYYKIISDNNLFRPLGWTKPDRTPKYELVGTIIGKDFARAYVSEIGRNRIHIVEVGDSLPSLGDVLELGRNKILLENSVELKSSSVGFLNVTGSKRNSNRGRGKSTSTKTSTDTTTTATENTTRQRNRVSGRSGGTGGGQQWQAQIQRFQNASPGEREQMIQQFRQTRGNRGQGSGRRRRNRNQ